MRRRFVEGDRSARFCEFRQSAHCFHRHYRRVGNDDRRIAAVAHRQRSTGDLRPDYRSVVQKVEVYLLIKEAGGDSGNFGLHGPRVFAGPQADDGVIQADFDHRFSGGEQPSKPADILGIRAVVLPERIRLELVGHGTDFPGTAGIAVERHRYEGVDPADILVVGDPLHLGVGEVPPVHGKRFGQAPAFSAGVCGRTGVFGEMVSPVAREYLAPDHVDTGPVKVFHLGKEVAAVEQLAGEIVLPGKMADKKQVVRRAPVVQRLEIAIPPEFGDHTVEIGLNLRALVFRQAAGDFESEQDRKGKGDVVSGLLLENFRQLRGPRNFGSAHAAAVTGFIGEDAGDGSAEELADDFRVFLVHLADERLRGFRVEEIHRVAALEELDIAFLVVTGYLPLEVRPRRHDAPEVDAGGPSALVVQPEAHTALCGRFDHGTHRSHELPAEVLPFDSRDEVLGAEFLRHRVQEHFPDAFLRHVVKLFDEKIGVQFPVPEPERHRPYERGGFPEVFQDSCYAHADAPYMTECDAERYVCS
ncbi:MAG: hypothetical protein BWY06_03028 [Candidatus Latescibacteria bacterium ADurb.Bin168]|nr:MAG: hypothetical protein BWY06_03028 [Candidatus Latescibacteria bacterium ADurb.Bin168]